MTEADVVARQLALQTSSRSETGVFVRMEGRLAVVNLGPTTVTIPCLGFTPPVAGMAVRVDWVNGSPVVTAPVRPLNPIGVITAAGTPRATVEVDGVSHLLPVMASYTPVNGDEVLIDWGGHLGIIMGAIAAVDTPTAPGESGGGVQGFTVEVRAANSGRYQSSSGWWNNSPRASLSNVGIWVYENRVKDAVGPGVTITAIDIYLPLQQQLGGATIGIHPHLVIPGGAPSITSKINLPLGSRSGWVGLPASFGQYVAEGGRGIGVADGGDNIWRGTAADPYSGALRISGVR